jgi:hypothetical protein
MEIAREHVGNNWKTWLEQMRTFWEQVENIMETSKDHLGILRELNDNDGNF